MSEYDDRYFVNPAERVRNVVKGWRVGPTSNDWHCYLLHSS